MYDALVIIPARYQSSRLPGKPLVDIAGKPMIIRTAERCMQVMDREQVIVATDDERIRKVCEDYSIRVEMTRNGHLTGGDRVAEVAARIPARTYINVQGDEPVFNPADIEVLLKEALAARDQVFVGYCPMSEEEWPVSKYPRLVFTASKQLLYIGRALTPMSPEGKFGFSYRQVCIYAYPGEALARFAEVVKRTPIESVEDHEVMRFLEFDLPVRAVQMSSDSIAVDRPVDVELASARARELDREQS